MQQNFEKYIIDDDLIFKYALGPSSEEGKEIHPYHEILLFKSGDAFFLSENENIKIPENTLFLIPRDFYHQFDIKDQNSYMRFVINFPHYKEYDEIFSNILSEIKITELKNDSIFLTLFNRLAASFNDGCDEKLQALLLKSIFLQLIAELQIKNDKFTAFTSEKHNTLISEVIQYISKNFTNKISLESIASEMNVSKSLLSHSFKKELGISLYRYITEKRLSYAYRLISEGIPATLAAQQCGYSDYSSFYRAYIKMFNKSPKSNAF